ncbi:MAG: hypothetical protein HOH88_00525 [Flavobacteriales bacterium]|nr:hypothetical protein [Flavobacteriales bacterium]
MKKIFLLFSASFFLMACPKETIDPPIYEKYGKGLYILTENGVNFYDFNEGVLKEDIYSTVNGNYLQNPSSLNSYSNKMYIVTQNTFYKVDAETFLSEFSIGGFTDAQQCENAYFNRFYVTDKGESEIKIIDLISRDISGHVSTGDSVFPTDIVVNGSRAFIINSGGDDFLDYDSTIVAIDVKNGSEPLNNFAGNIITGKNPVSICKPDFQNIFVVCKGLFDQNNPSNNINSSIYEVEPGNFNIISISELNNIYNADNLISNYNDTRFYITSSSGVYWLSSSNFSSHLVTNEKNPSVLLVNVEQYADTDTTTTSSEMLYMNNNVNGDEYIYKYNIQLNKFVDSIMLKSPIIDLEVYK